MFAWSHDPAFGLSVFLYTGKTNTDDDYQTNLDVIEFYAATLPRMKRADTPVPCLLLIADAGNPTPNAPWRRKFAAANAKIPPPAYCAFATSSALVRGAMQAIQWLRPLPYDISFHATFEQAVAWLESRRGTRLAPLLHALHLEARRAAEAGVHSLQPLATTFYRAATEGARA